MQEFEISVTPIRDQAEIAPDSSWWKAQGLREDSPRTGRQTG